MRIRWTLSVRRDLHESLAHESLAYVAEHDRLAAIALADRIDEQVSLIARFPRAGRPGRVVGTRELAVTGTPYVLAYRLTRPADRVDILAVRHGARDWPGGFPES